MLIRNICFAVILSFSALWTVGCQSKGFSRADIQEQMGRGAQTFDEKEIKDAYNKKPNLPKPFKLAVYFKRPWIGGKSPEWRWTEKDKSQFDQIAESLKAKGLLSDVFPIIDSVVGEESLRGMRLAAAKHQADAILIIDGGAQIDRYINGWGWSYILLLPTLFVPGSKADTLFMTSAGLWDVKNEYLYATAEAEATSSDTYIAAFGERDQTLVDAAKTQALEKLKAELEKMILGKKL